MGYFASIYGDNQNSNIGSWYKSKAGFKRPYGLTNVNCAVSGCVSESSVGNIVISFSIGK